jgi:2-polyprenyl-6-methoxyphenol hydroxylase-like FAD-dependent oxidoreductase
MVAATPLEDLVVTDIHDRPPLSSWSKGRVTLLGDAAHPMSPFMGQGANMAIEDALCLARSISESAEAGAAFRAYEAERLERTTRMAKQSRQVGMMGQWENPLACWLRDRLMSVMSRFMDQQKQEQWLYGYEA